jgi:hypothetical protein
LRCWRGCTHSTQVESYPFVWTEWSIGYWFGMIHCCTHLLELLSRRTRCVNWNGVSQASPRLCSVFLQNAHFRSVDFQYLLFCAASMVESMPGFVVPQAFAGCDGVNSGLHQLRTRSNGGGTLRVCWIFGLQ